MTRSARWLAALALALAWTPPAEAVRYSRGQLRPIFSSGTQVAFRQHDGTATFLDVRTGAVARRGGSPPYTWEMLRGCEPGIGVECPLPFGVKVRGEGGLEGGSGASAWRATLYGPLAEEGREGRAVVQSVHAVDGKVIVVRTLHEADILECLDASTGQPLWMYVAPYPGRWNSRTATEMVEYGREALQRVERRLLTTGLGTVQLEPLDGKATAYPGTLRLDPDPARAGFVGSMVLAGWITLGALAAGVAFLLRSSAEGRRIGLLASMAVLGVLIVLGARFDALLGGSLWALFFATVFAAHLVGRGRPAPSRPVTAAVAFATVALYFLPAFLDEIRR